MRDDELQRVFGSLADASDPDPAFADQLFVRLSAEAVGRHGGVPWAVLVAAALLVAAIAAGAVVASGLVKLPWTAVVDPAPSEMSEATQSPTAAPSVAPELPAVLPAGSLVRTLTEVPLLRQAAIDAPLEATIPAGEIVLVQIAESFGPLTADGEVWYPVAWSAGYDAWPAGPASGSAGWIAVAPGGAPAVEVVQPRCAGGAPTVASLEGLLAWERVACLGDVEITLQGSWVAGGDGITPLSVTPDWLGSADGAIAAGGAQISFVLAPDAQVPSGVTAGSLVTVVGHHDDPAARTCTIDLEGPVAEEPAHLFCREVFVVTSVRVMGSGTAPAQVGSLAATLVDRVRLRTEPGTAANLIGTLALGAVSYVADGPVEADGYRWWLLAGRGIPWQSGCEPELLGPSDPLQCPDWYGWAADGSPDGQAWLTQVSADCPVETGVVAADYGRQPLDYLVCYGGESREYVGWLPELPADVPADACLAAKGVIGWLACGYGYDTRLLVGPGEDYSGAGMSLAIDPASGLDLADFRGGWVAVRGHFHDPAAADCAAGRDVLFCEARFVVEEIVPTSVPGG